MDYGYPQFTEAKILSEFIKTDAYRMEVCLKYLSLTRRRTDAEIPYKNAMQV